MSDPQPFIKCDTLRVAVALQFMYFAVVPQDLHANFAQQLVWKTQDTERWSMIDVRFCHNLALEERIPGK